jgi:hypothetical protein
MKAIPWYDQPAIGGVKPFIKTDSGLIRNPDYMKKDPVNHPPHYCSHPSGVECINITQLMSFNVGNAFKYLYRCTDKNNTLEDLRKAQWYIRREIERRIKFRFHWFAEGEPSAYSTDIEQVLIFEYRFSGWMCQTLENLFIASKRPRGVEALDRALIAVGTMIQMLEDREGKAV